MTVTRKGVCLASMLVSAAAILGSAGAAAAQVVGPPILFGGECLRNFSKDSCDGSIGGGRAQISQCDASGNGRFCSTLTVSNANWKFALKYNGIDTGQDSICTAAGPSDELPQKNGTFVADTNFQLRLQQTNRFRGWLEGKVVYFAVDGTRYEGTVTGNLGVGTKRKNRLCPDGPQTEFCEEPLDAIFIPDPINPRFGLWRVGVKATVIAKRVASSPIEPRPPAETLRLTIGGDFYARGDCFAPTDPGNSFRFTGVAEGVLVEPCRNPDVPIDGARP